MVGCQQVDQEQQEVEQLGQEVGQEQLEGVVELQLHEDQLDGQGWQDELGRGVHQQQDDVGQDQWKEQEVVEQLGQDQRQEVEQD